MHNPISPLGLVGGLLLLQVGYLTPVFIVYDVVLLLLFVWLLKSLPLMKRENEGQEAR